MKILYGCSNCSNNLYNRLFVDNKLFVMQSGQKYHNLLAKGFSKNNIETHFLSGLPINRIVSKKLFISEKDEIEDGVNYHYYNSINIPILRQLSILLSAFFSVLSLKSKREETYILCDVMNVANGYGLMLGAKLLRLPIVFIVLDLPEMLSSGKINRKFNEFLFQQADAFVLLTEEMNKKVNKKGVPYIVQEGHVDKSQMDLILQNRTEYLTGEKIIVYAGATSKLYGVRNLVEGIILANIPNVKLKIFGDGDLRDYLESISRKYDCIEYCGVKCNSIVVQEELRAALLVNPRPSHEEYTKYSFPSKNMEYMVSGTPVLTTRLPGMPREYEDYVYMIKEETSEGIAKELLEIFSNSAQSRYALGSKARDFVLNKKNNVLRAKELEHFLLGIKK